MRWGQSSTGSRKPRTSHLLRVDGTQEAPLVESPESLLCGISNRLKPVLHRGRARRPQQFPRALFVANRGQEPAVLEEELPVPSELGESTRPCEAGPGTFPVSSGRAQRRVGPSDEMVDLRGRTLTGQPSCFLQVPVRGGEIPAEDADADQEREFLNSRPDIEDLVGHTEEVLERLPTLVEATLAAV